MIQPYNTTYIAIDTETTGLDSKRHEIIEFSGLTFEGDRLSHDLTLKIKMTRPDIADPKSLEINRYKDRDWSGAMSPEAAAVEIAYYLKDAILIGHNVPFDRRFIISLMMQTDTIHRIPFRMIDTRTLCIAHLARYGLSKFGLRDCCDFLAIDLQNHHSAKADAFASWKIFQTLCPVNPYKNFLLHQRLSFNGGRLKTREFLKNI